MLPSEGKGGQHKTLTGDRINKRAGFSVLRENRPFSFLRYTYRGDVKRLIKSGIPDGKFRRGNRPFRDSS